MPELKRFISFAPFALGVIVRIDGSFAAEPAARDTLEEVTVTATRQVTELQDTPVAVSAFSSAYLEQHDVRQFSDLLDEIPNVQAPQSLNGAGSSITIRGISSNARLELGNGVEQPAGAYLDEVFVGPRSFLDYPLFDIAQIEVLRGPQGTLWGRNTSSGAVTYTTNRPTRDFEGYADTSFGNYGLRSYEGAVSGPLVADKLLFRLSGLSEEREGYTANLAGGSFGTVNDKSVRGQLLYQPTPELSAVLIAQYLDSSTIPPIPCWFGLPGYQGPSALNVCTSFQHPRGAVDVNGFVKQQIYSLTSLVNFSAGGYKLTSITGYNRSRSTLLDDDEGSSLDIQADYGGVGQPDVIERFTQEFRVVTPRYGGWADLTAGLYYYDELDKSLDMTRTGSFIFQALGIALPFGAVAENDLAETHVRTKSYAAFGQVNVYFADRFWLTLGGRFNHDRKTYAAASGTNLIDASNNTVFSEPLSPIGSLPDYRKDVTTGLVTANYQATADDFFYLTVSQGYKAGGFNPDYVMGPTVVNPTYGPERALNFELGARTSWFAHRLDANFTAFRMNYNGLQEEVPVTAPDGTLLTQIANAARARSQGLELEAAALPAPQWHIRLAGSLLDAKFIEYPSDMGNLSGNRLPFASKATGALTVRYETLLDGNLTAYAQGEGNVSAGYYTDPTNQAGGHQGSYAELNARIGMRQDGRFHWELGLWARNLTNRAVITDYNPTIAQNPVIFGGASFLYFGAPRTFGADVNLKF